MSLCRKNKLLINTFQEKYHEKKLIKKQFMFMLGVFTVLQLRGNKKKNILFIIRKKKKSTTLGSQLTVHNEQYRQTQRRTGRPSFRE